MARKKRGVRKEKKKKRWILLQKGKGKGKFFLLISVELWISRRGLAEIDRQTDRPTEKMGSTAAH